MIKLNFYARNNDVNMNILLYELELIYGGVTLNITFCETKSHCMVENGRQPCKD